MQAEMYQVMATVEGMKALNQWREMRGESQAYGEEAFLEKADALGYIAHTMREVLRG